MRSDTWKGLTTESAKHFYNTFGAKQDKQAFYEDNALNQLIERGHFKTAASVFEFGCGTGRFAEILFRKHFPPGVLYTGSDISTTMLQLSKRRLESFSAQVTLTSPLDTPLESYPANTFDRFVTNYVLDLLSEKDIQKTLVEAHRILSANGLLCLTTITHGDGLFTRMVSFGWNILFRLNPDIVKKSC